MLEEVVIEDQEGVAVWYDEQICIISAKSLCGSIRYL